MSKTQRGPPPRPNTQAQNICESHHSFWPLASWRSYLTACCSWTKSKFLSLAFKDTHNYLSLFTFPHSAPHISSPAHMTHYPLDLTCAFLGLGLRSHHHLGLVAPASPPSGLSHQTKSNPSFHCRSRTTWSWPWEVTFPGVVRAYLHHSSLPERTELGHA